MELLGQHADALLHLIGWVLGLGGVAILATLRACDEQRHAPDFARVRAGSSGPIAPTECGEDPWPDDDRALRRRRVMELLLGSVQTSRAPPGTRPWGERLLPRPARLWPCPDRAR